MTTDAHNIRVPPYTELLNPTLDALRHLGNSASIGELLGEVVRDLELSPAVTNVLHSDGKMTRLAYNLGWARTYLKGSNLVDNPSRGFWRLTELGRQTNHVDPKEVVARFMGKQSGPPSPLPPAPSKEKIDSESSNLLEGWEDEILGILRSIKPDGFERLCQRLLRESGFIEVEVTGQSGDGGIDGNGIIRLAGLISFPVLFQCKRYAGSVGASTVRDFRGAMQGRADKGLIITTGTFTKGAHQEATRDGAPPIDLIDGMLLINKIRELRLGVRTETVERVIVDASWFESV